VARGYSPSGLEDLAACPYKFYAGHILRIPVPEDPAPGGQIAANTMGTLFHRVLELYFVSKDLSTACDQAFTAFEAGNPGLYPLVIKSAKQLVINYLSSFLKIDHQELKDSGFEQAYAEQKLESPVPELGPGLAHVNFRGRMDRIDLKKEGGSWVGRVVDYKSGKAREVSGKIETALIQGKFLQLPIYMGLVRAFLAKEKGPQAMVEASTLRWLRLEDQGEPEPYLASTFWTSPHAKTFIENLKGLVEIAEAGHFHIVPSTGEWGHCSRCDYARVCHKEHMPTRARAENDPVAIANGERLSRTAKEKK
jgi:RecB family exonuclease